jgi:hypothetical protein
MAAELLLAMARVAAVKAEKTELRIKKVAVDLVCFAQKIKKMAVATQAKAHLQLWRVQAECFYLHQYQARA